MKLTYNPRVFEQADMEAAKRIIVTPAEGRDTEDRWALETPYLADLIGEQLGLRDGQLVIDYGCGVGRLAKALIERFGCRVLGVDISKEMRALAPRYVDSPLFSVVSRSMLEALAKAGLRADAGFSAWVLQHCKRPADDIHLLATVLGSRAPLVVVNSNYRWVPTLEKGWVSDRVDIREALTPAFRHLNDVPLDPEPVGRDVAEKSFFARYERA